MKRVLVFCGLVLLLVWSTSLAAKGLTTRITIKDTVLGTSVEITDEATLAPFNIWAGPGTYSSMNGGPQVEGTHGFIIDWPAGAVATRPEGLRRYELMFYVRYRNAPATEQLAYVVYYESDPASRQGFVYLPGRTDEHYGLNVRAIHRRLEGQWFRASEAWQSAVGRVIAAR